MLPSSSGASHEGCTVDKLFFPLPRKPLSKNLNNFTEDKGHSQLNLKVPSLTSFLQIPEVTKLDGASPLTMDFSFSALQERDLL